MAFGRGFDVASKNRFSGLLFHYEKPRRAVMEQGTTLVNRAAPCVVFLSEDLTFES